MNYREELVKYIPKGEEEERDYELILKLMNDYGNNLLDRFIVAHFSVSAWIINGNRDKVLMAFHKIYQSYSWLGGHLDGMEDALEKIKEEIHEESGLKDFHLLKNRIISLEVLPVKSHYKNGHFVSSHLHLNLTYLFEGNDQNPLVIKEDENQNVRWISLLDLKDMVSEKDMLNIYKKIQKRV